MATSLSITQSDHSCRRQSSYIAAQTLMSAGTGAMAFHYFGVGPPGGGALFGTAQAISFIILDYVLDKLFDPDSTLGAVVKVAMQIFALIGITLSAVAIAGYTIPLTAMTYLIGAMSLVWGVARLQFEMVESAFSFLNK